MGSEIDSTSDAMTTFLSAINLHAEIESKTSSYVDCKGKVRRPDSYVSCYDRNTTPTTDDSVEDSKPTYVVELDDKLDEHFVSLLMEPPPPKDMYLCNTEILPGARLSATSNVQFICLVRCLEWPDTREQRVLDRFLNEALTSLYNSILFKVRQNLLDCVICFT